MANENTPEFGSTEFFYGKEIAEKEKLFKDELSKIEANNIEYFKSRKPFFKDEEHDKLSNHYIIVTEKDRVMFNFVPDSSLSEDIKQQVSDAFERVYQGAKQNPK